jgi:hypothetical protein
LFPRRFIFVSYLCFFFALSSRRLRFTIV